MKAEDYYKKELAYLYLSDNKADHEIIDAMEAYHQSQIQALKEEVEKLEYFTMNTGSFGDTTTVSKEEVLNIITNIEDK